MELIAARTESSASGRARLVGTVSYDDRPGQVEEYWFDVAEEHAGYLSRTCNPWLVCLAPLAATLGQKLRLALPVDRLLYRNILEVMAIWRSWYPKLHPVEVEAQTIDGFPQVPGEKTGAFFSGGVDSFFTAVRSREAGAIPVDDLVMIGGFDIRLANLAAFERHRERMAAAAAALGKTPIDVATNLRDTRLQEADWGRLWHGCGLASAGLALEGRYRRLVIASTHDYRTMGPHGSHPLTDSLLSTGRTDVLHDGADHTRLAKLEYLAGSPIALQNLHVCYRIGSDRNCGSCEKCLRTMAVLEILGCLSAAPMFPAGRFEPQRLARAFLSTKRTENYYRTLRSLAADRERADIIRAVDRAVRRSRWRRQAMRLPNWLGAKRGFWRAAGPIRRTILAGEMV